MRPIRVVLGLAALLSLGVLAVETQAQSTPARVMSKPGTVIEAESLLSRAHASAGDISVQNMQGFGPQWSRGSQLFWRAPAPVDSPIRNWANLTLPLDVPSDGSYSVTLHFTAAPDYGNVRVFLRGKAVGDYLGHAAGVELKAFSLGEQELKAGSNQLILTAFGKASASSNYFVGLDRIEARLAGASAATSMLGTQRPGTASQGMTRSTTAATRLVAAATASQVANGTPEDTPQDGSAKTPGPDCDSTCLGNVSTVYRKSEAGQCHVWFRLPCTPYDCDEPAGVCRQECQYNGQCAQGSLCDTSTGLCAVASSRCEDAFTVKQPNGQAQSCMPYKCVGGSCQNVCSTGGDCGPGYACNASVGVCIKTPK